MEYYGSFEEEPVNDPRNNPKWVKQERERYEEEQRRKRLGYDEESAPDYDPWTGSYY